MGRIRREVVAGDATVVMEDVTTLKNYFVQRDEQVVVVGGWKWSKGWGRSLGEQKGVVLMTLK